MRTVLYCKHSKGSRPLFAKIKCNIAGLLRTGTLPHQLAAQDPARLYLAGRSPGAILVYTKKLIWP